MNVIQAAPAHQATLTDKFQIVIPKAVRRQMKLEAGEKIMVEPINERYAVIVRTPADHTQAMRGLGKEIWEALGGADQYVARERSAWDK